MPTGQQSYSSSIQVVTQNEIGYTASVQPMRTQAYSASVNPVLQPDRFVSGSVEARPNPTGAIDRDYHASVYALFNPITPERFTTGSVYAAPTNIFGQSYSSSIEVHTMATFLQDYFASVKLTTSVDQAYSGSIVKSVLDNETSYTGSVTIGTPTSLTYSASVITQALNIVKAYTASIRPYIDISPAEHTIRDTNIALLIFLVQERDALILSIAEQTARLAFDNAEITRLLNILNDLDNKPSCRLSGIFPNTLVPRTGGSTMFVDGFEFIPTCTVTLSQPSTVGTISTHTPVVTSSSSMSFTLPNFTTVIGLDMDQPISILVNNADGQVSETLTFTLAPA
jgi:hypothetical protein